MLVGSLELFALVLQQSLRLLQIHRLLLEPVVRGLQFLLPRLELAGQQLRLHQQVLGAHPGLDRVEHDADAFGQLGEERHVRVARDAQQGELDDGLDLPFEQHRQDDDADRLSRSERRADAQEIVRHVLDDDRALFGRALPDQPFAQPQALGQVAARTRREAGDQFQMRLLVMLVVIGDLDIDRALQCMDQRRDLRQDHRGRGRKIAMALQQPAEARGVGLQPILLRVLQRGLTEIADHLVDVIGQVFPGAASVGHVREAAELSFAADFARDPGDFRGERAELPDHRVDHVADAQEFSLQRAAVDVELHRLRQVAAGDRFDDACHFARRMREIRHQEVHRIDRLVPGAGRGRQADPLSDPAVFADFPAQTREFAGSKRGHVGQVVERLRDLAVDSAQAGREARREIALAQAAQCTEELPSVERVHAEADIVHGALSRFTSGCTKNFYRRDRSGRRF